jgi:hypothetical protein
MLHGLLQVLLYAVLAGLSPLAFAATIAVMRAGRPQALAFGIGFVVAQTVTFMVFLVFNLGVTGRSRRSSVQVVVELVLAVALVWLARAAPRLLATRREASGERTHRLLERLGRVRLGTALGAGALLGVGGAKRLVLSALAATIITAGFGTSAQIVLGVVYVAVATVLVWAPVIIYMFSGQRAVGLMRKAQEETARHQPKVTVYALLLLAALFALDAVATLVTK